MIYASIAGKINTLQRLKHSGLLKKIYFIKIYVLSNLCYKRGFTVVIDLKRNVAFCSSLIAWEITVVRIIPFSLCRC
jgi:hypothetical protein